MTDDFRTDEPFTSDFTVDDEPSDFRIEDTIGAGDMGPIETAIPASRATASDQGPCLYLGPAGQRCNRRAVKDGFCALHQPGATALKKLGKPSKIMAAIAGLLGVLWPYVYDFVREIIRLLHPR